MDVVAPGILWIDELVFLVDAAMIVGAKRMIAPATMAALDLQMEMIVLLARLTPNSDDLRGRVMRATGRACALGHK
jgi:hypothetical protein